MAGTVSLSPFPGTDPPSFILTGSTFCKSDCLSNSRGGFSPPCSAFASSKGSFPPSSPAVGSRPFVSDSNSFKESFSNLSVSLAPPLRKFPIILGTFITHLTASIILGIAQANNITVPIIIPPVPKRAGINAITLANKTGHQSLRNLINDFALSVFSGLPNQSKIFITTFPTKIVFKKLTNLSQILVKGLNTSFAAFCIPLPRPPFSKFFSCFSASFCSFCTRASSLVSFCSLNWLCKVS